ATLLTPITACPSGSYGATRLDIPAPGTYNPDHNPPRIAPRNIFDVGVGTDNLFHAEKVRTKLRLTVENLTNAVALYNFLSTFSGTHFVTPRTYMATLGWVF
ncbi:MAG: TonB-dependent receptor, partial [Gammaproteobacteria bacterium]